MNYVQTNYIGKSQTARAKKTTAVASATQQFHGLDAETQRRRGNPKRQAQVSACPDASDGFLRTSFLLKLETIQIVQAGQGTVKMQNEFFKSLSSLAGHYGIVPMATCHFDYPYNMALAVWDMQEKLKHNVANYPELRVLQDSEKTYLISEEKYNTGIILYYIPIQPIYQMTRNPKRKRNAQLLLSVFSYLYHSADIPYFRQQGSYLYWMYEMHREWAEQDEEREENEKYLREFDKAEMIGDCMEQKIFNRMNLKVFEQRLNSFTSRDAFDENCLQTARSAFDLYTEYPNESLFRNAPSHNGQEQDDPENENIGMEKYISFISDTTGWLYESLAESINNEFNEYAQMDEPTLIKCFDQSEPESSSLDFESRLFALLDDLCELLYNYKQPEND